MLVQRCICALFLCFLFFLPLKSWAADSMSLGGLQLGMSQAEVMARTEALGLVVDEPQGQGSNTTMYSFKGSVFGMRPLSYSCFFQNGFLSDIIIDFSPDSAEDISKLKSSIAELKTEWDMAYGSGKDVFQFVQEEGFNKLVWDLPGRKAGISYPDDYASASFYVRLKLGNSED